MKGWAIKAELTSCPGVADNPVRLISLSVVSSELHTVVDVGHGVTAAGSLSEHATSVQRPLTSVHADGGGAVGSYGLRQLLGVLAVAGATAGFCAVGVTSHLFSRKKR